MKKADGVPTESGLDTVVQRWRTGAAQEDAAVVGALQEQAAEAVAAARAALPLYTTFAAQHAERLRREQEWLKDRTLERSKWFLDVATARERGREMLDLLTGNPPLLEKHLGEVQAMGIAYARTHRLSGTLIPALVGMSDTATQLDDMLAVYDAGLAELTRRLRVEAPDLAPRPALASAGLDGPPSGPRRAKGMLSGDDDA
jgi:hypothetical protein